MENYLIFLAIIIVIILQLIIIFNIKGYKKQGGASRRTGRSNIADKVERKDAGQSRGNNSSKKSGNGKGDKPQPQQSRSQQSPTAIDPVEKSLRDINLKLKNAEREQESARKKIQDNNQNDTRGDSRPQQQRGGNNRHDGGKNDRPPRRDFNRDAPPPRREPRPEPQHRPEAHNRRADSENAAPQETMLDFAEKPQQLRQAEHPVVPVSAAQPASVEPAFDTAGDMQHGRKFTAKRRQLPENMNSEESQEAIPATGSDMPNVNAQPEQENANVIADVSYGRGRR